MALATYKDLCIDAADPDVLGRFWASALHLRFEALDDGDAVLRGDRPEQTVWVNKVPEPQTVKHRLHIDIRARSVADVEALGATVVDADSFGWVVMKDPEGGELCVFETKPDKGPGFMEINVDTTEDHRGIAAWWGELLGVEPGIQDQHGGQYSYLHAPPHCPWDDLVFVAVPEPKTVKNRLHLDVTTSDLQAVIDHGATVLREQDDEIGWTVLADPQGNEFCAFVA
jgi:Glyoxalase-like domain